MTVPEHRHTWPMAQRAGFLAVVVLLLGTIAAVGLLLTDRADEAQRVSRLSDARVTRALADFEAELNRRAAARNAQTCLVLTGTDATPEIRRLAAQLGCRRPDASASASPSTGSSGSAQGSGVDRPLPAPAPSPAARSPLVAPSPRATPAPTPHPSGSPAPSPCPSLLTVLCSLIPRG